MKAVTRVLKITFVCIAALSVLVGCGGGDDDAPKRQGVALPADFPTDQVPMIDGAVMAADKKAGVWTVTIQARADQGNALDSAVVKLTDAGYTESSRTDNPGERAVMLSKEVDGKTYWVNVGISATSPAGAGAVIYIVTPA
ncbi:MAG: hypothetical protein QM658_13600 [Gordonia sp. (in: high G+C Gram-positive bacteria)]